MQHVWGKSRGAYRVLVGKQKEGDHLKDLDRDERIILKWTLETWDGDTNWIDLAQDRAGWRAVVNAVMSIWVP
jgi:hypothetical protein